VLQARMELSWDMGQLSLSAVSLLNGRSVFLPAVAR